MRHREQLQRERAKFERRRGASLWAKSDRDQIRDLASDLERVWEAETTSMEDRKTLVRFLIKRVHLDGVTETGKDPHRRGVAHRSPHANDDRSAGRRDWAPKTPQAAVERIKELLPGQAYASIAAKLNEEGFRTAKGMMYDKESWATSPGPAVGGADAATQQAGRGLKVELVHYETRYNDTYNNLRPRIFDGSHLDFPGMNQTITLRPHQVDAVWRGMSAGNTLLAHVVGAGKTFTMAATGMKMKQAGLIKKPMYAVPNHMLEQFGREFLQLYPNAKLLIATKDDLARERRKFLTAKVASGEWDGIIVTHSSFERMGMSRGYQEQFLREQIAEYEQLLCDHARGRNDASRAHRNIIKTIEKQKASREARLKELLAEDKKDDGLVFDELGVDHLFIDEAHFFKNLETPTKMDRVAGIQTGGSERAFDLYMKARYLDHRHPGHGVTFATGTPISNTMVEMFTMQRFLDPEGLREPWHRAFRRLGRNVWRGHRHDGNLSGRCEPSAPQPLCEVRESSRSFSRCSGRSRTCRRPRCSICHGPHLKVGRRWSFRPRCPTSRQSSRGSWSPVTHDFARRKWTPARTTPFPSPPTAASSLLMPGSCLGRRRIIQARRSMR